MFLVVYQGKLLPSTLREALRVPMLRAGFQRQAFFSLALCFVCKNVHIALLVVVVFFFVIFF